MILQFILGPSGPEVETIVELAAEVVLRFIWLWRLLRFVVV